MQEHPDSEMILILRNNFELNEDNKTLVTLNLYFYIFFFLYNSIYPVRQSMPHYSHLNLDQIYTLILFCKDNYHHSFDNIFRLRLYLKAGC